jgi:hypothetical protein
VFADQPSLLAGKMLLALILDPLESSIGDPHPNGCKTGFQSTLGPVSPAHILPRGIHERGIAQMVRLGWYRAVHVKNMDMQKSRSLLSNRKLLKRKLIDIENHIRGTLRAYGLLIGAVGCGSYEARVRDVLEHSDPIFSDD